MKELAPFKQEFDIGEFKYEFEKMLGWDKNEPQDDSDTALVEQLKEFRRHPNIFDFRAVVQRAPPHLKNDAARGIIQELCRIERRLAS